MFVYLLLEAKAVYAIRRGEGAQRMRCRDPQCSPRGIPPCGCIEEGNGNPLQCSCLENPRDGGAWWAAVYGVTQSRTRLKRSSFAEDHLSDYCQESRSPLLAESTALTLTSWPNGRCVLIRLRAKPRSLLLQPRSGVIIPKCQETQQ